MLCVQHILCNIYFVHVCLLSATTSQGSRGLCIHGWSLCARATTSTADLWSRASWRSSAASRKRSTPKSWSHTECLSCSRSSGPARYYTVSVACGIAVGISETSSKPLIFFCTFKYTCCLYWAHLFVCVHLLRLFSSRASQRLPGPPRPTQYQFL